MATKIIDIFYGIGYAIGFVVTEFKEGYNHASVQTTIDERLSRVRNFVYGGHIVAAVGLYRELFGVSLEEAKKAVTAMEQKRDL